MGWDFVLTLDFGDDERSAAERLADVVHRIHQSAIYQYAFPTHLDIYRGDDHISDFNLGQTTTDTDGAQTFFESLARRYRARDYCFEIAYSLPLFVQLFDEDLPFKQTFPRRFIFHGDRYSGSHYTPTGSALIAGDARHFRKGRTRDLNLSILMHELVTLADWGVRTVRGYNVHGDSEPHRQIIVYHDRLDYYFMDLHQATGEHFSPTDHNRNLMLDAILDDEAAVRYMDTGDFPLICSQRGTSGDLRLFYTRMLQLLQQNGDRPAETNPPDEA